MTLLLLYSLLSEAVAFDDVSLLVVLAGFAVLLIVGLALRSYYYHFSPLNQVPGPTHPFLWGCFFEIVKNPFMDPHKRWWKDAGKDVAMLHYTSLFGRHSLVILDKEIFRTILTSPAGKQGIPRFRKQNRQVEFLRTRIGDGLVSLEGSDWMRHRRIIQPSFRTDFLRESLRTAVPPLVHKFISCWKIAAGFEIDVASHLSALTLDIVGVVLFSHAFQGLDSLEEWSRRHKENPSSRENAKENALDILVEGNTLPSIEDPFVTGLIRSFKFNALSVFLNAVGLIFLDPYINPRVRRGCQIMNEAVDKVVDNAADRDGKSHSLLQLLVKAQDHEGDSRRLTALELRDETKTFLMAGHETTSTWVYWTLYALAKNPDIQERLYQHIVEQVGDVSPNKDITLEVTEQLDYLHAVLQEVLRLYSPIGMMTRINTYPEVFAGYCVPPETRLVLPMHLLHRNPKYWDDPEKFCPDRWLDVSDQERERRRFAFLPFSAGGRNCIGQRFANMEAKMIVASLVHALAIQIAPSQRGVDHTFAPSLTMKANPALKIVVKPRRDDIFLGAKATLG